MGFKDFCHCHRRHDSANRVCENICTVCIGAVIYLTEIAVQSVQDRGRKGEMP
jgi:hypothetical protein